jgi:hypothetical protein
MAVTRVEGSTKSRGEKEWRGKPAISMCSARNLGWSETSRTSFDDPQTMIALLGRWYDRLAQRVGQTMAGAAVLAVAAVVWLVIAWVLGDR